MEITREKLAEQINDNGRWEEFYQREGRNPQSINYDSAPSMYAYHKNRRLVLEKQLREMDAQSNQSTNATAGH